MLDRVIPPFEQLFMAQRANAHIVEVRASHPSMISHPNAAAELIEEAAQTVQRDHGDGGGDALPLTTPRA